MLNIEDILLFFIHLRVHEERKEKNEVKIVFINPVEAAMFKEQQEFLTMNFSVTTIPDISMNQINQTYSPNSTSSEPRTNIVLYT